MFFGDSFLRLKYLASLMQNVPPALLVCFLREHRSEWADFGIDAYSAVSLRSSPYSVPGVRDGTDFSGNQVILPLAHTIEKDEVIYLLDQEQYLHMFITNASLCG